MTEDSKTPVDEPYPGYRDAVKSSGGPGCSPISDSELDARMKAWKNKGKQPTVPYAPATETAQTPKESEWMGKPEWLEPSKQARFFADVHTIKVHVQVWSYLGLAGLVIGVLYALMTTR